MNRIKELRESIDLLQSALAKELNVKQNTVSSWERNRTEPDFESLRKMSEIFGVSIDYILGGNEKTPVGYMDDRRVEIDVSNLTPENRQKVLDFAAFLLSRQSDG